MNATSRAGAAIPVSAGGSPLSRFSTETPPTLTSIDEIACNYCGAKNGQNRSGDEDVSVRLLECSGCRRVFYCSKEHQRLDWPSNHKAVCDYKKNKGRVPNVSSTRNAIKSPRMDGHSLKIDRMLIDDQLESVSSVRNEIPPDCRNDQRPTVIKRPPDNGQMPANFSLASLETTKLPAQCDTEPQLSSDYAEEEKFDHAMNPPVNLSTDRRFVEQNYLNQARRMLGNNVHNQFDNRIRRIAHCVSASLKRYGWVVFDHLLGQIHSQHILEDVKTIYNTPGKFHDGRLVKTKVGSQSTDVRSDKIYWFDSKVDGELVNIGFLIVVLDAIMSRTVDMPCELTGRSKAMVACYPAGGTKYVRHVDNPNKDGRRITAIYYLNQDWKPEHGGVLRLYPETALNPVDIEPLADRLVFFWSDARNPHEVLPSFEMRFAVTVWYFDKAERDAASGGPSNNRLPISRNQQSMGYIPAPLHPSSSSVGDNSGRPFDNAVASSPDGSTTPNPSRNNPLSTMDAASTLLMLHQSSPTPLRQVFCGGGGSSAPRDDLLHRRNTMALGQIGHVSGRVPPNTAPQLSQQHAASCDPLADAATRGHTEATAAPSSRTFVPDMSLDSVYYNSEN